MAKNIEHGQAHAPRPQDHDRFSQADPAPAQNMVAEAEHLDHGRVFQGNTVWQSIEVLLRDGDVLPIAPIHVDAEQFQAAARVDVSFQAGRTSMARNVGIDGDTVTDLPTIHGLAYLNDLAAEFVTQHGREPDASVKLAAENV
jgi:hypothetical protein